MYEKLQMSIIEEDEQRVGRIQARMSNVGLVLTLMINTQEITNMQLLNEGKHLHQIMEDCCPGSVQLIKEGGKVVFNAELSEVIVGNYIHIFQKDIKKYDLVF